MAKNKDKMINGPINVIRLEGDINGINKVLYVYINYSFDIHKQTECKNIFSVDIDQHLPIEFKKIDNDKKYDLFLQMFNIGTRYEYISSSNVNHKNIYNDEVIRSLSRIFNFDDEKDKILESDIFKNIRLHYLDVDNDITAHFKNHIISLIRNTYENFQRTGIYVSILEEIIGTVNEIIKVLKFHSDLLKKILLDESEESIETPITSTENKLEESTTSTENDLLEPPENLDKIIYLYNKIFHHYSNKNIKDILNNFAKTILDDFDNLSLAANKIIDETNRYLEKITNETLQYDDILEYYAPSYPVRKLSKNMMDIQISLIYLFYRIIAIFSKFADIFLLRRFLDKEYITNAIVYTISYIIQNRSSQLVWLLVKYFDFKITHASYSSIPDIAKLNTKIKEQYDNSMLDIYFIPDEIIQCSNMNNFPDKFL